MMKRIIAGLFVLLLVMLAIVLIAPNFIDWNKHKDTLVTHATAYLGRDVTVGGAVSFRLLPNPQLQVDDVTVASVDGAKEPHFLKLKTLEAKVRFMPLLEGRVEIDKINLVEPRVTLEILDDGRASWHGLAQDSDRRIMTFGNAGDTVVLNDFTLRGGHLRYVQAATGTDVEFDNLNLSVTAPSLRGPYKILGDMVFRGVPVNVEMTTGQATQAQGLPVNLLFQPVEKLPQVVMKGNMTFNNGAGFDGTLVLSQGAPAALFGQELLSQTGWLKQDMTLSADFTARAGEIALRNIDAQAGKQGKITGSVIYTRPQMEVPHLLADLSMAHIDLGNAAAPALPVGMQAQVKLNGKTVKWRGATLNGLLVEAESRPDQWQVKNLRADMAGKAVFKASGVVSPAQNTTSLKIDLAADDVPVFAKTYAQVLSPRLKDFWAALPSEGLKISGNLDLRSNRASLYNFDTTLGAAGKAAGVLNVLDDGIEARLNISGFDVQKLDDAQRGALAAAVFAAGNDLDITGENIGFAGMTWNGVTLKAQARAEGVTLTSLTARMGDKGRLSAQGDFSGLPLSQAKQVNLTYDIAVADAAAFGKLAGFTWPVPLHAAVPVDLRGTWQRGEGAAASYKIAGNYAGGEVDMQSRGADAAHITLTLPESHRVLALFGADIDRLVSAAGSATLTADIRGTAEAFVMDGLRLETRGGGVTTGKIEKTAQGITTDVRAGKVSFDRWLSADIRQSQPLTLALRADEAGLRGLTVKMLDTQMTVQNGAIAVKALKGGLWDGTLQASGDLTQNDAKQWTAAVKGDVARFTPAQMPLQWGDVDIDDANLTFDLNAKPQDKTAFGDVSGRFSVSSPRVTVHGFDPAALTDYLEPLRASPQDLVSTAHKMLRGGAATYRDVEADFDVTSGKISTRALTLDNSDSTVKAETTLDTGAESFDLKAFVTLKGVSGLDPLTVTRAGKAGAAADFKIEPKALSNFGASRIPAPEPVAVADEPVQISDIQTEGEMLPPGYLDVPGASHDTEAGDAAIGEILPVEEQPLEAIATEPLPQPVPDTQTGETDVATEPAMPDQPPAEAPAEDDPISGILDRLGQ